jgi:hypothetical protein
MRPFGFICLLAVLLTDVRHQAVYVPPRESASLVKNVPWSSATPIGAKFRARFLECDAKDTCDGAKQQYGCARDQNNNTALLRLNDGTIFFDGKMGVDADGSPYSRRTHKGTDQPETSFHYTSTDRPSVDADQVPYIVIPLGGFDKELRIRLGDIAAIVYRDRISYALVADRGLKCKIGEGSIELHEELGHKVCKERNRAGECTALSDSSIETGVLYFVFPGSSSRVADLSPSNARQRIAEEGVALFSAISKVRR